MLSSAANKARRRLFMPLFTAGVLLSTALPALAEPRLVRVIWDVGRQVVYTKPYVRTQQGHDRFAVPPNADAALESEFVQQTDMRDVLRKGDRVRLYVVNYNAVSHVWHESSVVEQVVETPSLVGPILNAALLAITGAPKLPSTALNTFSATRSVAALPADCQGLVEVRSALENARKVSIQLQGDVSRIVGGGEELSLAADVKKLINVPTAPLMWRQFDNRDAWQLVVRNSTVFGVDFPVKYKQFGEWITGVNARIRETNNAIIAVDRAISQVSAEETTCTATKSTLTTQRNDLAAFVKEIAGDDSALRQTIARFESASALWSGYSRRLVDHTWTDDAIEVVVKEPIQSDSVLRADAVFISPDKTETQRIQRSLVLGVETHVPVLLVSAGVAFNNFDFKQVQVVKNTRTAADGTVSAKNRLTIADDTSWNRLSPVWIQSVRVVRWSDAGLYATFGTTPDRNIFKNAIVGASVFVPRWKTHFTGGVIIARGYVEEDLAPVVTEFSDLEGFALADVSAATLPLAKPGWQRSPYVSVSFVLVSF